MKIKKAKPITSEVTLEQIPKTVLSEWKRKWTLQLGVSLTSPDGQIVIPVPSKELSPKRRYEIMNKTMEKYAPSDQVLLRMMGRAIPKAEVTPPAVEGVRLEIKLDPKKLDDAYKWLKAIETGRGIGVLGSWAGFRHRVYDREVLKITPEESAKIPYSKRELPPTTWNLPPEYMVAYFRVGGRTKAQAIEKVTKEYLPALQREAAIPKAKAVKGKAEAKYKELMKPRLEAHDKEIKAVNDEFMAGKMSSKEMNEKHKSIHKRTDAVAATMRKRVWGEYPETLPNRAELEKIQRMRSPRSQASDLARQHSVVINPDNPKVATWLKDQGTADIKGIDTPSISRRGSKISERTPRITPRAGRLK